MWSKEGSGGCEGVTTPQLHSHSMADTGSTSQQEGSKNIKYFKENNLEEDL